MRHLLLALLVAAGCTGTYRSNVRATVYTPDLVYVSPGVQVIADYEEPVFYSDGYYWRYDSGRWYRSGWYDRGWVYASPPGAVARIQRPHAYVRYRPHGYVVRRPAHRGNRPVVRDHRR